MPDRAREAPRDPLEIGKDPVASLVAQSQDGVGEEIVVNHEPASRIGTVSTDPPKAGYRVRRNATRSRFSSPVNFVPSTRLKNSTVSSSFSRRPSCIYGGESLMPRSGKVFTAPSPTSLNPLIIVGLKKRSILRSCIRVSV